MYMIDGFVAGKLYGTVMSRTGQNGKTFVTAKVRASVNEGEALFVNVIAFADAAKDALLALDEGDAVSLVGKLTPRAWADEKGGARPALDLVADAVLTVYHVIIETRELLQLLAPSNDVTTKSTFAKLRYGYFGTTRWMLTSTFLRQHYREFGHR